MTPPPAGSGDRRGREVRPAYAVGRVVALLTRPACLFVANNYLSRDAAEGVALAFLASGLAMAAIAADPHRRFYSRRFGIERVPLEFSFYVYLATVSLLVAIGCAIVAGVTLRFAGVGLLTMCSVLYFISEKVADEVLRVRLFERNFATWGRSALARSALQVASLAVLVLMAPQVTAPAIIVLLAAATLVVFVPQLPFGAARIGRLLSPRLAAGLTRRALRSLRVNWVLWAISLLGTTVGYLDRLVALSLAPSQLPVFTLIVMAFSVVPTAVDFFFLSLHRTDLLQQTISVRELWTNRRFQASVVGGLSIAVAGCVIILNVAVGGSSFPLWYVAIIGVVQTSMALSTTPQQILYWSRQFGTILYTETGFWLLLTAGLISVPGLGASRDSVFVVLGLCLLLRLAAYVWQADRAIAPVADVHAT